MSQQNTGTKAFTAAVVIPAYSRVKYDGAGAVSLAVVGSVCIGVAQHVAAIGEMITIQLRGRTSKVIAGEALADAATLYASAGGKVQDTASGTLIGIAFEAATAVGDIIEALIYQ
jgi:hypothetical protein